MADVSQIKLPNNETYDLRDARLSGIYTVKGTQTAKTGSWTGTIDAPALYDGMTIAYYLPYAVPSSTNVTLNLTLSDGTTTGAVNCYYTNATRITTHYGAGSTIILTYWSAGSISVAGTATTDNRWSRTDYDSTITYRLSDYYGLYKTYTALYDYQICLTKDEQNILPINTVNGSTATTKTLTTESFNPFAPIYYYASTTDITAGGDVGANTLYYQYLADLRYSFNTGTTLTARKAVYLVATLGTGCSATLAPNPISQTLPSTADGYIYIYLGQSYDTYRIELSNRHPVYRYVNGAIRTITADAVTVNGLTVESAVPSGAKFTDTVTTVTTNGSGNAITSISASNGAITATKGDTFLTSIGSKTTASLTVNGWSSYVQTVTVSGITTSSTVVVSPDPASYEEYSTMGVYCSAQGTNSLTFTCNTTPSNTLTVNIMIINI